VIPLLLKKFEDRVLEVTYNLRPQVKAGLVDEFAAPARTDETVSQRDDATTD
jgi:hypothetical protein